MPKPVKPAIPAKPAGILRMMDLVRPHWKALSVAVVAVLGVTITDILDPWPVKIVIDNILKSKPLPGVLDRVVTAVFGNGQYAVLNFAVAAVAAIAIVGAVSAYFEKYLTTSVSQWVGHDLRRTIYHHIQRLSLAEHDKTKTGDIITRVTTDIEVIQDFIESALLGILVDVLTLSGMIGVMFYLNWRFTLIALSVMPVLFIVVYRYTRRIKKASRTVRKKKGDLLSVVAEVLGSFVLIAACGGVLACYPTAQPTPPPASAPAAVVALAGASVMIGAGDIARCVFTGDEGTAHIVDSILAADSVAKVPDAVFTLGDNVQTSGSMTSWTSCFTPSWGRTRIMKNIRPTPGNHDQVVGRADAYYTYFGAAAGPAGKGYYSYDIGAWHAVVINSELIINPAYDPAAKIQQMEWLAADLKSNTKFCTIAYWHNPRFSSGGHGGDARMSRIWALLDSSGVDLVLSGHDHHYERFAPMSATGVLDTLKGMMSFVVGTGGAELRGLNVPLAANSVVRIQGHYGVLLLTLGAREFRSAFIDTDGRVWDPSGGRCQ